MIEIRWRLKHEGKTALWRLVLVLFFVLWAATIWIQASIFRQLIRPMAFVSGGVFSYLSVLFVFVVYSDLRGLIENVRQQREIKYLKYWILLVFFAILFFVIVWYFMFRAPVSTIASCLLFIFMFEMRIRF